MIELACPECIPDNMPLVTSHRAAGGAVTAASGDEVLLSCGGGGKFAAYPLLGALAAVCEAGRYRVRHDNALRHLLELGCQENVFEDVLHEVSTRLLRLAVFVGSHLNRAFYVEIVLI